MQKRKIGNLEVSAIGMGCMGFTHAYGEGPEEKEAIALVHEAFDLGCNFFDTAQMYSYFKNEEFVGKALKNLPRDQVVISDKFWPSKLPGEDFPYDKLSEKGLRTTLEKSLKLLQTDYIDIYTEHQMASDSLEEVAYIMGKFIQEGKIRAWGLSSPTAEEIKTAHAVTPLAAVQSEYSIMERKWEQDVIPLCRELNIGFVAFSPMANGFLSGKYTPGAKYEGDDVRRFISRFDPKIMQANQVVLNLIEKIAQEKGCTKAQVSLSFVLKGGEFIVPIPGMRSSDRVKENLGAVDFPLTDSEYKNLKEALSHIEILGSRSGLDIKKLGTVPENVSV